MRSFAVTWDYRCPFARNAHEHVLEALDGGAAWDVSFVPFSLGQVHVTEDEPDIWDRPEDDSGLLALQVGVAVRDWWPSSFRAVHRDLFALRHDRGQRLTEEDGLRKVVSGAGLDADRVMDVVAGGEPLDRIRAEHTAAARDHDVWGVPTFIQDGYAAFVRLMDRPQGNREHARRTVERVLELLVEVPELNELKHTSRTR